MILNILALTALAMVIMHSVKLISRTKYKRMKQQIYDLNRKNIELQVQNTDLERAVTKYRDLYAKEEKKSNELQNQLWKLS